MCGADYVHVVLMGGPIKLSQGLLAQIVDNVSRKRKHTARIVGCTDCNLWLHPHILLFPRRVLSYTLICTVSGEGAGSCRAQSFKGSKFCKDTPDTLQGGRGVGTRGQPRKDLRTFEALGSRAVETLHIMSRKRLDLCEQEKMEGWVGMWRKRAEEFGTRP